MRLLALIAGLAGLSWYAQAAAAPPPMQELVRVELAAESGAAPGKTLWVDAHFSVKPGWHIYWQNPGDSGLPTELSWTLPAGFAAGDIAWPVPERFVVGGLANYGYSGDVDLLVPITAPGGLKDGEVRIEAIARWLVCAEICIPGEATIEKTVPAATSAAAPSATADPAAAARFAAARARLPQPAPFEAGFAADAGTLRLMFPATAASGLDRPTALFFPASPGAVDQAADPKLERRGDRLELVMTRAVGPAAKAPARLDGVLVLRGAAVASRAYAVSAAPVPVLPADDALPWAEALVLAFLGGLILNLMPCVLPILSLKLLGLTRVAAHGRHLQGAAYAAGVMLSFLALGGALIALRAGGIAVGWGFQLQSPVVVGGLAYLMLAMGLSLSGVAEFGIGLAGAGSRLAAGGGGAGAFFTGVLATVVATPCTAPFMGAAVGAALIAPAPLALAIFAALGAGLALPLFAASFIPGLARVIPKPGPWMDLLKQLLAFPLYATAAWLVWVLTQEVEPGSALAALVGLVLVGFAVWIYGRTALAAPRGRRGGAALAALAAAAAVVLVTMPSPIGTPAAVAKDGLDYEPFTPSRLAALTAAHQPVFVNLTAAWCITCLVNERATLDRPAVRREFAARGVIALKGDWTRRDPDIAAFLERFGRSGVPLYLLYDRDGTAAVLPQILTESEVIGAAGKL